MLVAHSMGSHGGQQNFPFGYIPNELHGIGLPDFMTPGPPPGQPLLSEHDTQNLDSFLNCFDTGGDQNKDGSMHSFQNNMNVGHEWMMPPTFVGSETSLRPRGAEWQNFQMAEFTFGNDMNLAGMTTTPDFHNGMHGHGFSNNNQFDHNLLNQLHNAAQTAQPPFGSGWQPGFQPQPVPQIQQGPRPVMRFGSDSHFQPHGYAPPEGQFDQNTTPNLDWLEAQSSAANTQPNTEPNTQPSSPNWQKKRKLDDFQVESRRNGFSPAMNGYSAVAQRTPPGSAISNNRRAFMGQEQPPLSRSQTHTSLKQEEEDDNEDEDADYDEDDEPDSRTRSASPLANNKVKSNKTPVKPARARKKSTASTTPSKSKSKLARNSTGGSNTSRVPLTADQKKANHTNSEQRRRDATARAYAELYDLVPELDEMGKQSTMKKLEVVVSKVQRVKARVQSLRAALGFDIETGAPLQHSGHHPHLVASGARSVTGTLHPDMTSWPR